MGGVTSSPSDAFFKEVSTTSAKDDLIWHTTIDNDVARIFGHTNDNRRSIINYFLEHLPKVEPENAIKVGITGYWDKVDTIKAPLYAQTIDSVGRPMFFIDNHVIIQRYTTGDTLIFYNRDGPWSHSMANDSDVKMWLEKVKNNKVNESK